MRVPTALILSIIIICSASHAEDSVPGLIHNPFNQPVLVERKAASTDDEAAPEWADTLQAVLVAGNDSLANMNGELLSIGDMYEGFRLIRVDMDTATFSKDEQEIVVRIGSDGDEDDG